MIQVYKIYPVGFAANSYLLTADGIHAVAIDPAQPRILKEAQRRGLTVTHALLTHGHFDHIGGCAALQSAGAKVGCMETEREFALHQNLGMEFGYGTVPPFTVDFTFKEGDAFELCGIKFSVLHTPGHTAGSCCFLVDRHLFTGDTLFAGDVGRTDLPTGRESALAQSLQKLSSLEGDHTVFPGHGEDTTLETERQTNGYMLP